MQVADGVIEKAKLFFGLPAAFEHIVSVRHQVASQGKNQSERMFRHGVDRIVADIHNRNTAFTTAGGLHIGRKHTDPDWKFVDTYSSIRTHRVNAVFSCQVDRPGDDAVFRLFFADLQKSRLKEVVLEGDHTICGVALGRWRDIAALA